MYSDIRMGKTNIEIGGGLSGEELEAFKNGTMEDMARILQTKSGRELLKHTMHAEDKDGNALKTRITRSESANDPYTQAHDERRAMGGKGSSADIKYRPGHDVATKYEGASWGDEFRSDVVLYHELAHAKHMHDGKLSKDVDTEEMNTVGMGSGFQADHWKYFENRYRHERRQIGTGQNGGVVDGDKGMGQRDNFKGGEGGWSDWETPYHYKGERRKPGAQ